MVDLAIFIGVVALFATPSVVLLLAGSWIAAGVRPMSRGE